VVTPGGTTAANAATRFVYAAAVPTMGEWFMLLLALLLGGTGYLSLRRRQHAGL